MKECDHVEDLGLDEIIILALIVCSSEGRGPDSSGRGYVPALCFCEHGNQPSVSIKCG